MSRIQFSAAPLTAETVDTVNGVIRGVSVITSGIARGHGLEVDNITLDQMHKCANARGQTPVKVDHQGGAASVCGYLLNFRREANRLRADWHLLATHPSRDSILEIAQRMPRGVGLSAAFVSPDDAEPGRARCAELISVDYVTLPAANPDGLFSAKVAKERPLTGAEKVRRALTAAGRGVATGAVGGVASQAYLLKRRPNLKRVAGSLPATGALVGALIGGASQWRKDRDLAACVSQIFFDRERPEYLTLRDSIGRNVRVPLPGVEIAKAAHKLTKKPITRRIAVRAAKIGAGAGLGYWAGQKAGAITGAVAGALFSSPEVRSTVRLAFTHSQQVTNT